MFRIVFGRPFHTFGAATLNDLSPRVAMDLPLGGTSAMLSCERRPYLVGCFMVIRSKKYVCFQLPTVPKFRSPTLTFLLSFLFFYN